MNKNSAFLIPYILFVAVSLFFLALYSKAEIHIAINQQHNTFFDYFFRYATRIGNGVVIPVVVVILLFYSYRKALSIGGAGLLTGIFVQSLKRLFFTNVERPIKYFENLNQTYELYIVPGTNPSHMFSFPSGHAASAFALFFALAFMVRNKVLKFVLFILALLTAFSRVYLSWHFLSDIVAGSVIGIISVYLSFYIFNSIKNNKFDNSLIKKQ